MLFGPGAESSHDTATITATIAWWQGLLLLLSHAPAIPVIRLTWRLRLYFIAGVVLYGLLASLEYHACLDWDVACFGLSLDATRLTDYIWASYLLVAEVLLVLRIYSHEWASFVALGAFAVVIFASLAAPFSFVVQLFILLVCVLLLFIKAVLIDAVLYPVPQVTTALDAIYRFKGEPLALGVSLQALGLVCYMVPAVGWYWLVHSMWHKLAYTGLYFIIIGVTRDLIGWPGWRDDTGAGEKRDEGAMGASEFMEPHARLHTPVHGYIA